MKAQNPYSSLNFNETVDLIERVGQQVSVLVRGPIGCGKSSMLKELAKRFPDHVPVYVDITLVDMGDFLLPKMTTIDGVEVCKFVPNSTLGIHLGKPVLLLFDEITKGSKSVQNMALRMFLEQKLGEYSLPKGSIVFATGNLSSEGVGDQMAAHANNRICNVTLRKPSPEEWRFGWAEHNGVDPVVIATVLEYPECLADPASYERPEQNNYIQDARSPRASFVTPRSLEKASDILKSCRDLDESVLTHALIGVVGEKFAMDLLTVLRLDNTLPSFASIVASPTTAKVAKGGAALCLTVSKLLGNASKENFDAIMVYLDRLPKEAQALFARGVMSSNSPKRPIAVQNKAFTLWCVTNGILF
jgi:hypothetical protein